MGWLYTFMKLFSCGHEAENKVVFSELSGPEQLKCSIRMQGRMRWVYLAALGLYYVISRDLERFWKAPYRGG